MKLKSNDPLQLLLRSALHEARKRVTVQPAGAQQPLRQCQRPEWTRGRLLSVIYVCPQTSRRTYLGVFQELKSDLFKARRLVPSNQTAHGKLPEEIVTQSYWLHPKVHVAAADSAEEVRAIEARFAELMKEFG